MDCSGTPDEVRSTVRNTMIRAGREKRVPILVPYNHPYRDCAGYGAGAWTVTFPEVAPLYPGPDIADPDMAATLAALRAARGNVKHAAQSLGISRQRLYHMLDEAQEIDLATLRRDGEPRSQ